MRNIVLMISVGLSLGLVGCENAETHQHHLYNLEQCKAVVHDYDISTAEFVQQNPDVSKNFNNPQSMHDYHYAKCMADTEHTTIEYQQAKHDDYGKVEKVNITGKPSSNVHDIPEER